MSQANTLIKTKTKDEIAKAYSSAPWWYDVRGFMILTFAYRDTLWGQVRFFGRNIGEKHLEGAIGSGTLLGVILKGKKLLKQKVGEIVGFDYADKMLNGARHRFRNNKKVKLLKADVTKLPYKNNHFDTINIANAIHCFPDVLGGLIEVNRVLKDDGVLAMNVLLHPKGRNPLDYVAKKIMTWGIKKGILFTPYDYDEIKEIIYVAGFDIISEEVKGNTLNIRCIKNLNKGDTDEN